MDIILVLVLVVLLIFFLRRYLFYRNYVKHLADTLEAKQSYLIEGVEIPLRSKQMLRLTDRINTLILENRQFQQGRAGHMGQLEATLGTMFEGVLILDRNNRILMANKAMRDSFGDWIGDNEFVGGRVEVLFSSSRLSSVINQINTGEIKAPVEIELIQSEKRRWVRVSGARMPSNSPETKELTLLIFNEVTLQKELETVRKEFVANVSHELKTPVTIIKGYADTLVQDFTTMPEAQRLQFINKLGKNADRLHDLLIDLLSLSHIESGEPETSWEKVSINALIHRVLTNYTDRLEEHKMSLDLALSPTEIELNADPNKLVQVFENLFLNALKYTPVNSTLSIGSELIDGNLHLWVEDNGPGIPTEDLPRIFERFYRVEKGRSREKGGTGLGLSIVKRIIRLHGGNVEAMNVEGGGLRISIELPIRLN